MNIAMTGATGYIGKHLSNYLTEKGGHRIIPLGRAMFREGMSGLLVQTLTHCDVIINLAGAPINQRWTPEHKQELFNSRITVTHRIIRVNYELDVSKEPGHRIKNLKWPNGKAVKDTDTFVVAVNNYRATTQLLTAADIFLPGEELPKLLEIDVRGDVGGIRELLGEYIRTVKGGTIEPHVNNNWKIVGNNWKAADHQKAVQLLREGKLALNENADARTLPGKAITTADIAKF